MWAHRNKPGKKELRWMPTSESKQNLYNAAVVKRGYSLTSRIWAYVQKHFCDGAGLNRAYCNS
jgi:hypothetical protein